MFLKHRFLIPFIIFILLNLFLYLFILFAHNSVPVESPIYLGNIHHYVQDPRVKGEQYLLLRGLNSWDAQWYINIADAGYPAKTTDIISIKPWYMSAMMYAFFPMYPIVLFIGNFYFHDIELTAFLISNLFLVANFMSLYYIITKLYSSSLAVRTIFLLFLFPFSLFYRSYYTEGLYLFLLIWFCYFLIRKKWFYGALLASLLFVTRPNGPFMGLVLLFSFYQAFRIHKLSIQKALFYLFLSFVPFLLWCYYCYIQTGDAIIWYDVQSLWYTSPSLWRTVGQNISHIFGFFNLPFYNVHNSQIEILTFGIVVGILMWSRRFYKHNTLLWWVSIIICVVPLLLKDFMSFSRFQTISFPLFLFLATQVKGIQFYLLSSIFFLLLLLASLLFVNWYWLG